MRCWLRSTRCCCRAERPRCALREYEVHLAELGPRLLPLGGMEAQGPEAQALQPGSPREGSCAAASSASQPMASCPRIPHTKKPRVAPAAAAPAPPPTSQDLENPGLEHRGQVGPCPGTGRPNRGDPRLGPRWGGVELSSSLRWGTGVACCLEPPGTRWFVWAATRTGPSMRFLRSLSRAEEAGQGLAAALGTKLPGHGTPQPCCSPRRWRLPFPPSPPPSPCDTPRHATPQQLSG